MTRPQYQETLSSGLKLGNTFLLVMFTDIKNQTDRWTTMIAEVINYIVQMKLEQKLFETRIKSDANGVDIMTCIQMKMTGA